MFRYNEMEETTYYRDRFESEKTINVNAVGAELDFYAYNNLGSELDTYKIMDENFIDFIEERGKLSRLKYIKIPIEI